MTEQTSPEPAEGTVSPAGTNDGTFEVVPDDNVPVYTEPQPVPAGPFPTETNTDVDDKPADSEDHPDFLVEDLRDTDDEPADVPAPDQTREPDTDPLDEEDA